MRTPEGSSQAYRLTGSRRARPAAFLDRDGVLNFDSGYLYEPRACRWTEGAHAAVRELNDRGYFVFVVTNQAGVARGLYDEAAVRHLHAWMNEQFAKSGAHVDAFYYCPHHPEAGTEPYRRICDCRKPKPGMILKALAEWPVDLSRSFLVGDRQSDVDAGRAAGLNSLIYPGGNLKEFISNVLANQAANLG
jgi:D-glycero-D-manno-heptose 1,7-bisphosphate phosphatase